VTGNKGIISSLESTCFFPLLHVDGFISSIQSIKIANTTSFLLYLYHLYFIFQTLLSISYQLLLEH